MTGPAFVRHAYQLAREWGIQPSEFWGMSIQEWWLELETKLEQARRMDDARAHSAGTATRAEMQAARERLRAKQAKQNG